MTRVALLATLLVAGCAKLTAIDLTLRLVGDAADRGADVATLALDVAGDAQPFQTSLEVAGRFSSGVATLEYQPHVRTGTLTFMVTLTSAGGSRIAFGTGSAAVQSEGSVPLEIDLSSTGGPSGDMQAGPDLTTCIGGDGTCTPGCNANNDSDCPVVCGNGVVEAGETCDDGNTTNGDGCDPTCRYGNVVALLSGHAGSQGFADGTGEQARFSLPTGMATEGANLYVADFNVVRKVNPTTGQVTTVAGRVGDTVRKDGPGAMARFNVPMDLVFAPTQNKLYVVDNYDNDLRSIDLGSPTFDVATLSTALQSPVGIDFDGSSLVVLDSAGLSLYPPGGGNPTVIATAQQLTAVGSFPYLGVSYAGALNLSTYFVSMGYQILRVVAGTTPTITTFAGNRTTSGCVDGAPGTGTLKAPRWIKSDQGRGAGTLYTVDTLCQTVRTFSGGNLATYAGTTNSFGDGDLPPASDLLHIKMRSPFAATFVNGTLYVLEQDGCRIRKVTPSGTSILAGSAPFVSSVDKVVYGSGSASRYGGVSGYVMATDGTNAWTVLSNNDLVQVSLADGTSTKLTTLAGGAAGLTRIGSKLYLAVGGNLLTWDLTAASNNLATYAAGVPGTYLTTDGTNLFWLEGTSKLTVVKMMDAAKNVTTLAGQAGTTTVMDGLGAGASFAAAQGLACDGKNLYTLDSIVNYNYRVVVRQIAIATQQVSTIAGAVNMAGALDEVGVKARLAGAWNLATDGTSLFITDTGGGANQGDQNGPTIRQMVLSSGAVTTMVGKRGQWSAIGGVGTNAVVNFPAAIAVDSGTHTIVFYDGVENVFETIR